MNIIDKPLFYVLDDKMVAVFLVAMDDCRVKMECLFSQSGIEDYTLEYDGPLDRKKELMNEAMLQAQKLYEDTVVSI
ncbi:hypothetical protein ACNRWW_17330 [Metabacillus sp. HB246100]